MSRAASALALLFVVCAPAAAGAHSLLVDPPPISDDDSLKSGPCGCYFGAQPEDPTEDVTPMECPAVFPVTTFERGSTITVEWKETVNHSGMFRLAFTSKAPDQATKADLDGGVLYEEPDNNAMSGGTIQAQITLPDVTCTECVLQLRQFMAGAAKPYYYTCAAVKLVDPQGSGGAGGSGAGGAGVGGGGGSGGNVGGAGGAPTGTGSGPSEVDPSTGAGPANEPIKQQYGCNMGAESGAAAGVALALALVASRLPRRRKKQ